MRKPKYTEEQLQQIIGSKLCQQQPGMRALFEQRLERLRATKAKRSQDAKERLGKYQFRTKAAEAGKEQR